MNTAVLALLGVLSSKASLVESLVQTLSKFLVNGSINGYIIHGNTYLGFTVSVMYVAD